jgi:hypothetical protein
LRVRGEGDGACCGEQEGVTREAKRFHVDPLFVFCGAKYFLRCSKLPSGRAGVKAATFLFV